ncbi:hypothetical protein [Absidia glauca]|uniref:Uncharacterized protein n=1 Tax=Absidia glauca TaxID=4829 RepID=A0A163KFS9_ABSGL|nr:hypothetical protein [Absidia glauca]
MKEADLDGGAKSVSSIVQKGVGKRAAMFNSALATKSTMENPIPNQSTGPTSPGAREFISVAIPFDPP